MLEILCLASMTDPKACAHLLNDQPLCWLTACPHLRKGWCLDKHSGLASAHTSTKGDCSRFTVRFLAGGSRRLRTPK